MTAAARASRASRASRAAACVLVAALASASLTSCGSSDSGAGGRLAERLSALGLTLYLPELRESEVDAVRYDNEFPGATIDYDGLDNVVGDETWTVVQYRAPAAVRESVCNAVNPDNTGEACSESGGWAWDDYEGDTSVYVLRGETLLVAGVETEDDDTLTDETIQALLEAPEVDPADLAGR